MPFIKSSLFENWRTTAAGTVGMVAIYLANHGDPSCWGCALGVFLVGAVAGDSQRFISK
jgi:hypothetical protein